MPLDTIEEATIVALHDEIEDLVQRLKNDAGYWSRRKRARLSRLLDELRDVNRLLKKGV